MQVAKNGKFNSKLTQAPNYIDSKLGDAKIFSGSTFLFGRTFRKVHHRAEQTMVKLYAATMQMFNFYV